MALGAAGTLGSMTRAEARAEAERRNRSGSERLWAAQEHGSGWRLAQVTVPGAARARPSGALVESKPRPPEPGDPRPAILQNIPPYGPG